MLFAGLKGAVPILLGTFVLAEGVAQAARDLRHHLRRRLVSVVRAGRPGADGREVLRVPMRVTEPEPWALGMRFRDEPEGLHRYVVGAGVAGRRVQPSSDLASARTSGSAWSAGDGRSCRSAGTRCCRPATRCSPSPTTDGRRGAKRTADVQPRYGLAAVRIDFSSSQRTSLGVEWELELVDLDTRELTGASDAILADISENGDGEHPKAKHELLQSCIEVITGICQTVAEARPTSPGRWPRSQAAATAQHRADVQRHAPDHRLVDAADHRERALPRS